MKTSFFSRVIYSLVEFTIFLLFSFLRVYSLDWTGCLAICRRQVIVTISTIALKVIDEVCSWYCIAIFADVVKLDNLMENLIIDSLKTTKNVIGYTEFRNNEYISSINFKIQLGVSHNVQVTRLGPSFEASFHSDSSYHIRVKNCRGNTSVKVYIIV